MSRIQRAIVGCLSAVLIGFAVPASAAPGGLATAPPAASNQLTLVGSGHGGHGGGGGHWGGGHWGGGHGGGHWGHGGGRWGGGWGRGHYRGGYGYWGGGYYPYYDDYYYGDSYYGYDTCYYSRRLRARVCPDY